MYGYVGDKKGIGLHYRNIKQLPLIQLFKINNIRNKSVFIKRQSSKMVSCYQRKRINTRMLTMKKIGTIHLLRIGLVIKQIYE